MHEQDIIARLFAPLSAGEPGGFSLTDDAAVLTPPNNHRLVVTTDSVIQGVHVLPNATPEQYAVKLLRRNLSDLAAMGAMPWRYFLNLRVPRDTDDAWLLSFAAALKREQDHFRIILAGGDTTLGGDCVHLTLTALGLTDQAPLTRAGAQPGDLVYVSGTIGDAALGLALLEAGEDSGECVERYHAPQPRLAVGKALRGIASAALDCSDGLLKDLARLCEASKVGVQMELAQVPVGSMASQLLAQPDNYEARSTIWQTLITGGDDYELIFTAPPEHAPDLQEMAKFLHVPLTAIGFITADTKLCYRDEVGEHAFTAAAGWDY